MERNYEESALFEHQFWLKVLTDACTIFTGCISSEGKRGYKKATYFVETFTNLLNKVRNVNLMAFSKEAEQAAKEIRAFKLNIIQKQLEGKLLFILRQLLLIIW